VTKVKWDRRKGLLLQEGIQRRLGLQMGRGYLQFPVQISRVGLQEVLFHILSLTFNGSPICFLLMSLVKCI